MICLWILIFRLGKSIPILSLFVIFFLLASSSSSSSFFSNWKFTESNPRTGGELIYIRKCTRWLRGTFFVFFKIQAHIKHVEEHFICHFLKPANVHILINENSLLLPENKLNGKWKAYFSIHPNQFTFLG